MFLRKKVIQIITYYKINNYVTSVHVLCVAHCVLQKSILLQSPDGQFCLDLTVTCVMGVICVMGLTRVGTVLDAECPVCRQVTVQLFSLQSFGQRQLLCPFLDTIIGVTVLLLLLLCPALDPQCPVHLSHTQLLWREAPSIQCKDEGQSLCGQLMGQRLRAVCVLENLLQDLVL